MTFIVDPNADISDTSWVEDIEVATADLVRTLGAPQPGSDDYKVSGRYSFVNGRRVFTVYDWKATALYDRRLPSPLAFWNSQSKVTLSVGSNSEDVADFRRWLLDTVLTQQRKAAPE